MISPTENHWFEQNEFNLCHQRELEWTFQIVMNYCFSQFLRFQMFLKLDLSPKLFIQGSFTFLREENHYQTDIKKLIWIHLCNLLSKKGWFSKLQFFQHHFHLWWLCFDFTLVKSNLQRLLQPQQTDEVQCLIVLYY